MLDKFTVIIIPDNSRQLDIQTLVIEIFLKFSFSGQ